MNPHVKEDWFFNYSEERTYVNDQWYDTGLWVKMGGLGLVICTISSAGGGSCNAGYKIVDENDQPLMPYRTSTNNRLSAHFSMKPNVKSNENMLPVSFHMIASCQYARLQVRPSEGSLWVNIIDNADSPWNHKPISTMTALPLVPGYQGGTNTIFKYPWTRNSKLLTDDKPQVRYDRNKKEIT